MVEAKDRNYMITVDCNGVLYSQGVLLITVRSKELGFVGQGIE
jgi:hypothetical protein